MNCQKCRFENPPGMKFCGECGAKLEMLCPNCKAANPLEFKFCGECGHDLGKPQQTKPLDYDRPDSYTPKHLAHKILATRSSIEGERKLVTILFADVANSTAMFENLDPEQVHDIMDGCFRILLDEIHRYEGTINQFRGDGVMALFGAPIAHEDHAQRACHAALAIQKALMPYSENVEHRYGIDFTMRIGLNSGPVVVGAIGDDLRMDYTAQGDTANLAARMESHAEPGKVLVSENTYRLARDFFMFKSAEKIQLKGKQGLQGAYLLDKPTDVGTRIEASVHRGLKALVGRDDELDVIFRAFGKARRCQAQVVDIVGEAGIGKSRLAYEFEKAIGHEATFLTGACVHHGRNMNFLPVIDVVKAAFGIQEGMTEEEVSNRIVSRATDGLSPMIPFYRNLLSLKVDDPSFRMLDPEGRKYGTFEAVKNLLLAISAEKPLVVFLEDVHWIDKISEELFAFFSRCILDHAILMLSAYRPEGSPPWAQGAQYQRLGLVTLSSKSSIRLVRNMVGGVPLDPDLEKKIVAKTGGNPFFVEEIVRDLLDRRELAKGVDRYVSRGPIDQLEIPDTIQGVLSARMDRLSEDLKGTMQVASVIGRDFPFRLLKSIMELEEELRTHLSDLVRLEVLYEKCLYPELEYIFKHALTQEVAYESLLKQRRREIHGRIAAAIEELYPGRLEEHYEVLAYHYEKSGNSVSAYRYLMLAGEKSNRHNAVQSAREFFQKALVLRQRSKTEDDPREEIRLYRGLGYASLNSGDIGSATDSFRTITEISQRHGMLEYESKSWRALASMAHLMPTQTEALRAPSDALDWARRNGDKVVESVALAFLGLVEAGFGKVPSGYQLVLTAESIAMETGKLAAIFGARLNRCVLERVLGRPRKTVELTEGIVESLQARFALAPFLAALQTRATALAEIGRIEDSMLILKNGIDMCEKLGAVQRLGALYNCQGYCYGQIHLHEEALKLNLMGEEMACGLMGQFPAASLQFGEIRAQSLVNIMENLFDQESLDEAWDRLEFFKKISRSADYDLVRPGWESRMSYLGTQILLRRDDLGTAETLIHDNLQIVRGLKMRKREGGFLRLLGELQMRRGESDTAVENLNEAITILAEVGNARQLWQAYASLASVYDKLRRLGEAREKWGAAAETILNVASGLSDPELREGFLHAEPIRQILSKAQ